MTMMNTTFIGEPFVTVDDPRLPSFNQACLRLIFALPDPLRVHRTTWGAPITLKRCSDIESRRHETGALSSDITR